jgi:hypothetical protein
MQKLIILTFFPVLFSCNSGVTFFPDDEPKTPEELREELKTLELSNPLLYLGYEDVFLSGNMVLKRKGGIFRDDEYQEDGKILDGVIINTATFAKYKDVVINVYFYSQTQTLIEEKQFIIYEYFEPNAKSAFSFKVYPPSGYSNFGFDIVDAKPIYD